jgi:hypothetical protein
LIGVVVANVPRGPSASGRVVASYFGNPVRQSNEANGEDSDARLV